jgi:acyl-CoA hydrolase
LAATLQFTLQAAIQRWLGDVIELRALAVDSADSTLSVDVTYAVRRTNEEQTHHFERQV